MTKFFNEQLWNKHIRKPDWYLKLAGELKRVQDLTQNLTEEESEEVKKVFYSYIEEKLENGVIQLNEHGPDWDEERKPIDTIIIHHTSNNKPLTLARLNTKHMLRLYMPFFQNPNDENRDIKGKAMSSGHFMFKKQVFYGYHWLVRLDGSIERLLDDAHIGWHAGNWDINTRSIAICIDGNFENSSPDTKVLKSIASLVHKDYPQIGSQKILGHNEVNDKTICPGNTFLSDWKSTLINLIKSGK